MICSTCVPQSDMVWSLAFLTANSRLDIQWAKSVEGNCISSAWICVVVSNVSFHDTIGRDAGRRKKQRKVMDAITVIKI